MKRLQGIPVSPGSTIGKAFVLNREDDFSLPEERVDVQGLAQEIANFEDAITKTRAEILGIRKKITQQMGRENSDIFNAHLLILEDRTVIEDVIAEIKHNYSTAEYAFSLVLQRHFKAFSEIDDEYLKERIADIKDVGRRLLHNLVGEHKRKSLENLTEDVVVFARDLSPSDTAIMDRARVLAFVTETGGPTSHTAILGRSLEIPAVVGVEDLTQFVQTGDPVVVNGTHGFVIVHPDENTLEECTRQERRFTELTTELEKLNPLPSETLDGRAITLAANIEFHDEVHSVISHGAEGIGLYRTEYLYLNRQDLPSEEEQYNSYVQVAEKMGGDAVIIRTLDLGGDKFLSSLDLPHEMNPFLGWRAIRFCLTRTDIFKTQLRAILRASAEGNLKIMFPMICNLDELKRANALLQECREELDMEGIAYDEDLQKGAMIEIPSAALISDILVSEVDFFSIGTNDLIQYSLAVDRVNEKIAYLYEPTHPAILKLIKQVVDNTHAVKKWVGCCGEMAGDPVVALLLIGLGLDEVSASPIAVPKIKKTIRSVRYEDAKKIADHALELKSGREIYEYAKKELMKIACDLLDE